jgi:hypothetical protein
MMGHLISGCYEDLRQIEGSFGEEFFESKKRGASPWWKSPSSV